MKSLSIRRESVFGANIRSSFLYDYTVLWVILLIYTSTDVFIWPAYQSANVSILLYDRLWFASDLALMAISAITMFSIAVPVLIWLFNKMMVESLFYYFLQGELPPHHLPWLSLGTSTNLYIVSIAFVVLSVAFVFIELRWKKYMVRKWGK